MNKYKSGEKLFYSPLFIFLMFYKISLNKKVFDGWVLFL